MPLRWLWEPHEGRPLAFARGVFSYATNWQYRVNAKARHVACSQGTWATLLARRLGARHRIIFAANAKAGARLNLVHPIGVVVGRDVVIGDGVSIYQNVTLGQNRDGFPTVGDNVIIYAGAKINGAVHIGDNAVVGANAVVTRDVPANAIVAGVPARVVRYRDGERDEELY